MKIRVDSEVYAALKALATHRREGLNAVLRRVMMQKGGQRARADVAAKGGRSDAGRSVRASQHHR